MRFAPPLSLRQLQYLVAIAGPGAFTPRLRLSRIAALAVESGSRWLKQRSACRSLSAIGEGCW